MRGSAVRSVFEAAANGQLRLTDWRRRERHSFGRLFEELLVEGVVIATGRRFRMVSAPFHDGLVDEAAAELGRIALSQQMDQGFSMAGIDLKIKGLSEVVRRARDGIASVRQAASDIDQSSLSFIAAANAVTQQIDAARADIEFEATTLGNGGPASSVLSEVSGDTTKL